MFGFDPASGSAPLLPLPPGLVPVPGVTPPGPGLVAPAPGSDGDVPLFVPLPPPWPEAAGDSTGVPGDPAGPPDFVPSVVPPPASSHAEATAAIAIAPSAQAVLRRMRPIASCLSNVRTSDSAIHAPQRVNHSLLIQVSIIDV
jgi:hypothetical protein